ncbi:MAG TPA: DUF2231 domain-containing protein [Candidatus Sulfotelmatobacter sp.]|jgi:uncharacterized membrane protein|nr:DUF2231 domain-containing protein [Candidatus Sulfotelmatobacter sp.]
MSVHPFDLNNTLLAKHAQHVVLIHFPIALLITGAAFDLIGQWTKRRGLAEAAYLNFLAAVISTIPTLATGFLAWRFALEGQKVKGILLEHMVLAWTSSLLIWLIWAVHFRARKHPQMPPAYRLWIELAAVAVIALTGHLGGFLSGVNGPG